MEEGGGAHAGDSALNSGTKRSGSVYGSELKEWFQKAKWDGSPAGKEAWVRQVKSELELHQELLAVFDGRLTKYTEENVKEINQSICVAGKKAQLKAKGCSTIEAMRAVKPGGSEYVEPLKSEEITEGLLEEMNDDLRKSFTKLRGYLLGTLCDEVYSMLEVEEIEEAPSFFKMLTTRQVMRIEEDINELKGNFMSGHFMSETIEGMVVYRTPKAGDTLEEMHKQLKILRKKMISVWLTAGREVYDKKERTASGARCFARQYDFLKDSGLMSLIYRMLPDEVWRETKGTLEVTHDQDEWEHDDVLSQVVWKILLRKELYENKSERKSSLLAMAAGVREDRGGQRTGDGRSYRGSKRSGLSCDRWVYKGNCPNGEACRFEHNLPEKGSTSKQPPFEGQATRCVLELARKWQVQVRQGLQIQALWRWWYRGWCRRKAKRGQRSNYAHDGCTSTRKHGDNCSAEATTASERGSVREYDSCLAAKSGRSNTRAGGIDRRL
jgi:hypothetical protein